MLDELIIVADQAEVRVLQPDATGELLDQTHHLANEEGRLKAHELKTDDHGMAGQSGGPGMRSMDPNVTPTQHQAELFAKEVADWLYQRVHNKTARVTLVAPPQFLGRLRDKLHAEVSEKIVQEIDKNYCSMNSKEIKRLLDSQ